VILALAFLLGFALGWQRAAARGGDRLDRLQWGAAFGILFTLLGLIGVVVFDRMTMP
jgi:hypothetical protein